jgi:hypothetical protein
MTESAWWTAICYQNPPLTGAGFRKAITSIICLDVVPRSLANFSPESLTSSLQPECPSTTTKMFRDGP